MSQRAHIWITLRTTDPDPDTVIDRVEKELRLLLGDSLETVELDWLEDL